MKFLSLLCLFPALLTPLFADPLTDQLDALFEARIEVNEKYRDEFSAEAEELEKKEVREILVEGEKTYGQLWVDYLKRMKKNPDLIARAQVLRLELVGEIHDCYYNLEYAQSFSEEAAVRGKIVKWKKQLKKLAAAEKLLAKKKAPVKK